MNRNIEVEDSLYTELKNISENELDASINKLIDACVENLEIKNDTIVYYKKPKIANCNYFTFRHFYPPFI